MNEQTKIVTIKLIDGQIDDVITDVAERVVIIHDNNNILQVRSSLEINYQNIISSSYEDGEYAVSDTEKNPVASFVIKDGRILDYFTEDQLMVVIETLPDGLNSFAHIPVTFVDINDFKNLEDGDYSLIED
jgi:hypothetical protein